MPQMLSPDRKVAYMFTGQGSISRAGLWDKLRQSPAARQIFQMTDEIVGFPLSKLVAEGPMDELIQTKNAQPAIIAYDLAAFAAAKELHPELEEIKPSVCLGHSAGEIAALTAAGVFDERTGLFLAYQRGLIMQEYGGAGTMAALLADEETVGEICKRVNKRITESAEQVEVVNLNSPRQTVISGGEKAVMKAVNLAEEEDIIFSMLPVSNPFHHSVLMRPAQKEFAKVIAATEFRDAWVPVILNKTGQPEKSGVKIKEILAEQIASPVRWYDSVKYALEQGVDTFVEFGPRSVLTHILEEIDSKVRGICVRDYESAQSLSL